MAAPRIDYDSQVSKLLLSDPPAISYDIVFEVYDKQETLQGEVPAHKILLSLASSVFRREFDSSSGFVDKDKKVIKIVGTATLKTFRLMSDFLYNKPTDFDELTMDEIFDVVSLAHCYNISILEEELKQHLEHYPVTKESVIAVAKKAEEFAVFEAASGALLANCAKFLHKSLPTTKAVAEFSSQVSGSGDEAVCLRLFAMMEHLQPHPAPAPPCSNCQQPPCLNGKQVDSTTQVRVGTRLKAVNCETAVVAVVDSRLMVESRGVFSAGCRYPVEMFHFAC